MVRKCSRIRSMRQLGNAEVPDVGCVSDEASCAVGGSSKVRTLSTSRAASCSVPRSLGSSQPRGTLTPGEPNGRGGTAKAAGCGTGRGSVGCPGRKGMFAVKSLYVTDQRAPFGPTPSCRTVLPFGAGMPATPGGGTPGVGAGAPSAGAGVPSAGAGAAPPGCCVGVGGAGIRIGPR